jgi:site-specific recombinase XerD
MFRDTFAVSLFEKGVQLETVSVLLGHSSIRVTEKHYRPWARSLQQNLETAVGKARPDVALSPPVDL